MKNLRDLFKKYKHEGYRLNEGEISALRAFIGEKDTRHLWDADIALRLYAYSRYNNYTEDDVNLFESYLYPDVIDVARKSSLWSLVIIWKRYSYYNEEISSALNLKDTEEEINTDFRSGAYMCIATILFEDKKNKEINKIAREIVKKFNLSMNEDEKFDYKYFIEHVYSNYFQKINNRGTINDFKDEEIKYYTENFENMLKLKPDIEYE